jgi:hypothetical protein
MTEHYEIEISLERDDMDSIVEFYSSTVVACDEPRMTDDILPMAVFKHAEMLRRTVSDRAIVVVGDHRMCKVTSSGINEHATTIYMAEWASAEQYRAVTTGVPS